MDALIVDQITIPEADLSWTAVRSSGPGGQNVNKVASKVELRFDLEQSQALSLAVKSRLRTIARSKIDKDGVLLVVSQKTRDQQRNLEDARLKLGDLVRRALEVPEVRKATKPSRAAKRRRLADKRHIADKKTARRPGGDD